MGEASWGWNIRAKGLIRQQLVLLLFELPAWARFVVDSMCEIGLHISDALVLTPSGLECTVLIWEIKTGTVHTVHLFLLLLRRTRRYWR